MKKIIVGFALMGIAFSSLALDKAELDNRIRRLTSKFLAMQEKPDKSVPVDQLRRAHGVILLDRTKAGFIFAYQGGGGVAMVKDSKTKKWSPPAFLTANEASLGFQVGGEQNFYVILLMTTNAAKSLADARFEFGGEARGTAGEESAGEEGKVTTDEQPVLVYDDRKGLYGGAAIKGGALAPDDEANRVYYEQAVTLHDVLFEKKVKPGKAAIELTEKLNEAQNKKKE